MNEGEQIKTEGPKEEFPDKPKSAEEVNLNKFPTTYAATKYLESIGWRRGTFKASSYNPFQNLANLERILRIEARKVGRQLTQAEVENNFPMFENVISFLYNHENYKKDTNIDEEISIQESMMANPHLRSDIKRITQEKLDELRQQKSEGRIYSKRVEAERQKDLENLKPEARELLARVLEDINKKPKRK